MAELFDAEKVMKPETTLVLPPGSVVTDLAPPSPAQLMREMIQTGVTKDNADAFAKLVELSHDMEDRSAKKAFATAFIALQREIDHVKATKVIPDKYGKPRSSFAPFEEIDAQAKPLCLKHGFTYSFEEGAFQQGRVTKVCVLLHEAGHERRNPYSVRIGSGPPGCSESQADGSAHSYAKRGALCDALNIVVTGIDNDARVEGAPITKDQADELERRVKETNSNRDRFMAFAFNNAADAAKRTFGEIPSSMYPQLDAFLRTKERGGR